MSDYCPSCLNHGCGKGLGLPIQDQTANVNSFIIVIDRVSTSLSQIYGKDLPVVSGIVSGMTYSVLHKDLHSPSMGAAHISSSAVVHIRHAIGKQVHGPGQSS